MSNQLVLRASSTIVINEALTERVNVCRRIGLSGTQNPAALNETMPLVRKRHGPFYTVTVCHGSKAQNNLTKEVYDLKRVIDVDRGLVPDDDIPDEVLEEISDDWAILSKDEVTELPTKEYAKNPDDLPEVIMFHEAHRLHDGYVVCAMTPETVGQDYVFARLDTHAEHADTVRGELPDCEKPVVYVGDNTPTWFVSPENERAPEKVRKKVEEKFGVTVIHPDRVAGGWASWGGRPEFEESRTYLAIDAGETA